MRIAGEHGDGNCERTVTASVGMSIASVSMGIASVSMGDASKVNQRVIVALVLRALHKGHKEKAG